MDIIQEELDTFKAAANRMRWFISTAVLISVLILLHVYLEQFSFQYAQLEGIQANRIMKNIPEGEACYAAVINIRKNNTNLPSIDSLEQCSPPVLPKSIGDHIKSLGYNSLVREYSSREFQIKMTDNTVGDIKMPSRQVPILGIEIPANDFVLVMATISMFFVVGVWLNLRGLHAALTSLSKHNDKELMRIAQLNTVFLTSIEIKGSKLALNVRASSLWLPFFSILLATCVGYFPLLLEYSSGSDSYAGSNSIMLSFLSLSIAIITLHYWIAGECLKVMRRIDQIFITS